MQKCVIFATLCLLVAMFPHSSAAQTATGCTRSELQSPPRIVYRCAGGILLEAEAAAALGFLDAQANDRPTVVELSSDAILIDVETDSGPFQIRTPHAIAAVRGTLYAVSVSDAVTEVFVSRGEVTVSRPDGADPVVLTAGLGVDVSPGQPLVVRQWQAERVNRLLSRFGR